MGVSRILAFTVALAALGGCATTHGNLSSSADRLERNAAALARDGSYGSETYSRDARDLAEQAHDFRLALSDRRAGDPDVETAFNDLSRSYHALRDEVDHADSGRARDELKPVTEAYLDVEREMGGAGDRHRYARDGYERDRARY
jgi:hypothetical protein